MRKRRSTQGLMRTKPFSNHHAMQFRSVLQRVVPGGFVFDPPELRGANEQCLGPVAVRRLRDSDRRRNTIPNVINDHPSEQAISVRNHTNLQLWHQ